MFRQVKLWEASDESETADVDVVSFHELYTS